MTLDDILCILNPLDRNACIRARVDGGRLPTGTPGAEPDGNGSGDDSMFGDLLGLDDAAERVGEGVGEGAEFAIKFLSIAIGIILIGIVIYILVRLSR